MYKSSYCLLLLGIFGIFLLGCKNDSKNENEKQNKSSSKLEINKGAHATITLEDGYSIEMTDKRPSGNSNAPSRFTVNLSNSQGLVLMVQLDKYKTPLENKVYDESTVAKLVLTSTSNESPLGAESYRSYNEDEAGKEGEAIITLKSFENNRAEGKFKGILYSPSHKKAVVEGDFTTTWKKKW